MRVYLIRHGQSTENRGDEPVVYPPLTALGKEQARRAGAALTGVGVARLYCSPMRRNLQTAKEIAATLNLDPHVLPELCEYGGIWARSENGVTVQRRGLTRSQILDILPNAVLPDSITDEGWWFHSFPGDTDDLADFSRRNAESVWQRLRRDHGDANESVALVGHGRSGSVLLSALFGLPTDRGYARFGESNCGVSLVEMTDTQTRLVFLNRTDHLPAEIIT